jgi:hypothetical protein
MWWGGGGALVHRRWGAVGIRESRNSASQSALRRDGLVGRRVSSSGTGSGVGAHVGSRSEAALVLEREESSSVLGLNGGGQKYVGCIAEASSACVDFEADGDG